MRTVQADFIHVPGVMRLIAACVQKMRDDGIDQWDEIYPNEQIVTADAAAHCLYVLEDNDGCIAAITLNQEQHELYKTVQWSGAEPALVIHRLCVDPAHRGARLGDRLVDFAEQYAREHSYASIRLDAYTGNPAAMKLYERRGYRRAGQVYFPRRSKPVCCFEKILTTASTQAAGEGSFR